MRLLSTLVSLGLLVITGHVASAQDSRNAATWYQRAAERMDDLALAEKQVIWKFQEDVSAEPAPELRVVLDKPAGLLSVPGIGPDKADCLARRVADAFPGAGARIVHRLDRDTSGVIVMAFDAEAHRELSRQFHDRELKRSISWWWRASCGRTTASSTFPCARILMTRRARSSTTSRAGGQ